MENIYSAKETKWVSEILSLAELSARENPTPKGPNSTFSF